MSAARIMLFCATIVVSATAVLGYRWHQYVTNTESPYDEVGMGINGLAPSTLNKWGCDRLHATFGDVLPPMHCEAADGKSWR